MERRSAGRMASGCPGDDRVSPAQNIEETIFRKNGRVIREAVGRDSTVFPDMPRRGVLGDPMDPTTKGPHWACNTTLS